MAGPFLVILRFDHGHLKPSWDPGAHADIDGDGVRATWEQEAVQTQGYGSEAWKILATDHGAAVFASGVDAATIGHLRPKWNASGLAVVRYGLGPVPEAIREADGTWPPGYRTAHRHTNGWAALWKEQTGGGSIVICLHCNAGGGTYGMVAADDRSVLGKAYRKHLIRELAKLPELSKVVSIDSSDDRDHKGQDGRWKTSTGTNAWIYRGLSVIDYAYKGVNGHAANLLEPGFLDAPTHAALWYADGHRRIGQAVARACVAIAQEIA